MYLIISKKINSVDNYILFFIRKYLKNKYLDILMPFTTRLGNLGFIWIVMAIILMLDKPYRAIGNSVILTLLLGTAMGEGIVKHVVRRVRPCKYKSYNLLIEMPITYSFPSGHALSSFAVAEVLSMSFGQYKFIFMGIAFLIAFSRLYLDVHYPTDVIAGIIIGILCSKLIFIILK